MTLRRAGAYWGRKKAGGGSSIYDDAIYIFSPRLLRSAYTGPCARVRRSSDNAEQDINFVGGVLDEASIISFCGASNGFMNYYNQGTDSTNYPTSFSTKIYDGSSILKINGFPALFFNAINVSFRPNVTSTADYLMDKPCMIFATAYSTSANSLRGIFGESLSNTVAIGQFIDTRTNNDAIYYRPDGTLRQIDYNSQNSINTLYSLGYSKNGSGVVNSYRNGTKQTAELTGLGAVQFSTTGTSALRWGAGTNSTTAANQLLGYSHEYIAFNYYDATKLADVQSDQISYYGI